MARDVSVPGWSVHELAFTTTAAGGETARRYDPRTGEEADLGEVAGGGARSFALPDGADWVVYLTSAAAGG